MAHTPGPWKYSLSNHYWFVILEKRGDLLPIKEIANIFYPDEELNDEFMQEAEDNARLIAAAPEMLEALKAAQNAMGYDLSQSTGEYERALRAVSAVIAKAERQP